MRVHTIILFPYNGFTSGSKRENMFWDIVECCLRVNNTPPVVILNRDTKDRQKAKSFLEDERTTNKEIRVVEVWSVDTCQMWLKGWGYVIDNLKAKEDDRIVQLPGDIDTVTNRRDFLSNLESFIIHTHWEMIIGDFTSGDLFNAKELIDWYGTYALMANWFPKVAKGIHSLPLNKPRSEFLNIQVKTLRELLGFRKFAYEQTLNMLIRSWDFSNDDWKYKFKVVKLGELKDDTSSRQYRDCLDQIERTERMLKLLWREVNYDNYSEESAGFIDLYDQLDRNSTSIRENSRIIIRNFLGLGKQDL
jgi:hypothetical protein